MKVPENDSGIEEKYQVTNVDTFWRSADLLLCIDGRIRVTKTEVISPFF